MLKQLKWSNILLSIAYIIIGILLIIYPDVSANVISYMIGIGLCVMGIVHLTSYFLADVKTSLNNNSFSIGLVCIIFGLVVIVKRNLIMDLIPFILGLIIITSGLMKVQRSVVASRIHYSAALTYAILGAISIVFGIAIMFFLSGETATNILFIVIGCGLVYSGVSDLFVQFFLTKKFNDFIKAFEEAFNKRESNVIDTVAVEQPKQEEVPVQPVQEETKNEQAEAQVVEPKDIPEDETKQ